MPQNYPHNRQNPGRKDESIRRANRVIQSRTFVLMLVLGVAVASVWLWQMLKVSHAI